VSDSLETLYCAHFVPTIFTFGRHQPPAEIAFPQVIPDGAGPVKSADRPLFVARRPCWTRRGRARGQGSGIARPRSGRRALTPSPVGASCAVVGSALPPVEVLVGCVDGSRIMAGVRSWGASRSAARSSLRGAMNGQVPSAGRMMGCADAWDRRSVGVNQNARPRRVISAGVMTCTASRPTVGIVDLMPRAGSSARPGRDGRAARRRRTRSVCGLRPRCRCSCLDGRQPASCRRRRSRWGRAV